MGRSEDSISFKKEMLMSLQTLDTNSLLMISCPRNTHQWKPKINIHLEQGRYLIKTATSLDDFAKVLELRRQVFLQEFAGLKRR